MQHATIFNPMRGRLSEMRMDKLQGVPQKISFLGHPVYCVFNQAVVLGRKLWMVVNLDIFYL